MLRISVCRDKHKQPRIWKDVSHVKGASIVEDSFGYLNAPVERIVGADVPTPYAANLERMAFPQVKDRAFCLLNLWVTSALRDGVTQTTTTTIPSIISPIAKLLIGLL
ncbi:putative pyruvate dehydrogenase (acetyl-transferring) [Helianthus annuus]|nr:putative pyruvate dehydrogenase (acetyl-transferring) [Helianthus annuus]